MRLIIIVTWNINSTEEINNFETKWEKIQVGCWRMKMYVEEAACRSSFGTVCRAREIRL